MLPTVLSLTVALLNSFKSLKMTDIKAFSILLCARGKKETSNAVNDCTFIY